MTHEDDAWYFQEDIVAGYESFYSGKYRRADLEEKSLLHWLLGGFDDIGSLLEIGCGTAHFTKWFESLDIRCAGLDLSPLMLQEAKRLWSGDLTVGSSSKLPFADSSFDLAAFITCMEYMPDPMVVLKEARRVARKGIIWGIMNRWSIPTVRRMIQVSLGKNPFYKNAHFFSLREAKKLIGEAYDGNNYELRWRATVFPRIVPLRNSSIPFGALLGVSVDFKS